MDLIGLAVSIAVALAAVIALTVLVTAIRVSRVRLKRMRAEAVDLARVPAATRSILDVGRRWLLPRSFRYVSSWRIRPMLAKASEWKFCDVYVREDAGTFAVVSPREQPGPGDTTAIEFESVFADGSMMTTFNRYRHAIVWEPPGWTIDDDCVADLAQALDNHVRRVRARGAEPLTDPAQRDRIANEVLTGYIDAMVARRKATRSRDGEVRMRFAAAAAFVIKLLRGNMRAARVKIVPLVADAPAPPGAGAAGQPEVAADLHAYFSRRAVVASASGSGKWRMGAISAAAFIALGAFLWDWRFALMLLGVIAFHEGGHYLAMKWVGYRNLNVFFVPGLGGLATGEKQDASAAQKVLVYLAGPVPGIALATAGLIALPFEVAAEAPWMNELLMIMLVINVINLLPVTPLDGGRVMEVLLFVRWPRMRVAFAAASALVLVGVGYALGETVMLVIGLLVAFSLPTQWRFSKLARKVKREPGARLDEQSAARRVFEALADAPFRKWSFQHRASAADELIAELRTPAPGIVGTGAGLALYAVCLVAPLLAAVVTSPGFRDTVTLAWEMREAMNEMAAEGDAPALALPVRDWEGEFQRAKDAPPEQRLALLADAAEAGYVSGQGEENELTARTAEMRRIAETLPRGSIVRVRALRVAADPDEDPPRTQARLRTLLEELRDAPPEAAVERARVGAALAQALESSPERLQLLMESRDALRERVPPGDYALAEAWSELARELAQHRDMAAADREWSALMAWHAGAADKDPAAMGNRDGARMGYATFLVKEARFDEAEGLLRPSAEEAVAAAAAGERSRLSGEWWKLQALFWLAVRKGDAAQATAWLAAWEKSAGRRFVERNPQFGLARLAAAELAKDVKGLEKAREQLAALPGTPAYLCKYPLPMFDGTEIGVRRAGLIARYAICPPRPG